MSKRFYERFEIKLGSPEVQRRFINRFINLFATYKLDIRRSALKAIATGLGERYNEFAGPEYYVSEDFHKCLLAIETTYAIAKDFLSKEAPEPEVEEYLDSQICSIVDLSEHDLGVRWKEGRFIRTGAGLLDERLVNESLRWLSSPKYKNVSKPFEKGLSLFLKAEKHSELLSDVITDMYESLEALAKIVTEKKSKDLSANAELFIKKIKASEEYKAILREYINFANAFRHAVAEGREKPSLSKREVESFIYLTGLFLRLAMGEA
jgi:hypothetical protein